MAWLRERVRDVPMMSHMIARRREPRYAFLATLLQFPRWRATKKSETGDQNDIKNDSNMFIHFQNGGFDDTYTWQSFVENVTWPEKRALSCCVYVDMRA